MTKDYDRNWEKRKKVLEYLSYQRGLKKLKCAAAGKNGFRIGGKCFEIGKNGFDRGGGGWQ